MTGMAHLLALMARTGGQAALRAPGVLGAITTGVGGAWRIYTGNPTGTVLGSLGVKSKVFNIDFPTDPIGTGKRVYFRKLKP